MKEKTQQWKKCRVRTLEWCWVSALSITSDGCENACELDQKNGLALSSLSPTKLNGNSLSKMSSWSIL